MGNPTDELRARLDERGVEYEAFMDVKNRCITKWRTYHGAFVFLAVEKEGKLFVETASDTSHSAICTPGQAIAVTVGMEKWEPSKEWKAWHDSLKHDNPTSIREAVENILYEAIDFGGDMGPNGNVWSGVDEGAVLTENCIDGWVESVESIAATVGAGTCKRVYHPNRITKTCTCSNCGYGASDERWAYCPKCGHKYVHGEVEERWKRAGRKVAE